MEKATRARVTEILNDTGRSKQERVAELVKMRDEARAIERAKTESAMAEYDSGDSGLAEIENALHKLGVDAPGEADEKNAATL